MQQFLTSDDFQDQFKCKPRHTKNADLHKPSPGVIQYLLAYAAGVHVFKTKSMGNINILMN
ncbi:MAG: hypothetical protein IEMM0006_1244 [bacterium]|nr:MAG: hypothetical protein IEMM0006_1244 [bacterium]